MLAQSFPDLGLTEGVLFIVRIIATVGGAVVGWFAADPLTRLAYRLTVKKPTPGPLLFSTKSIGAITLALLIYTYLPLGGAGGGLGFGPGLGGGPGKGPGKGGDKINANGKDAKPPTDAKDAKDPKDKSIAPKTARIPIEIEVLGGPRFKRDGKDRYYLVKKTDPALNFSETPYNLEELETSFKAIGPKLQIRILHTDDTAVLTTDMDPTRRLQKLAAKYDIPTVGPK
jgi:hypothetical protein